MQTELTFLISLLLNDELPKNIKELVAERIKQVEANYTTPKYTVEPSAGGTGGMGTIVNGNVIPTSVPQTQAAAQALAARQAALDAAASGKPMKGATGPAKFHGAPKSS